MKSRLRMSAKATLFIFAISVAPGTSRMARAEGSLLNYALAAGFAVACTQTFKDRGDIFRKSMLCASLVMLTASVALCLERAVAEPLGTNLSVDQQTAINQLPAEQKARITQLGLRNASHEAIISELLSTPEGRAVMNEFLQQSRPESTPLASTRAMKPDSAQSTVPAIVASNSAANLAE